MNSISKNPSKEGSTYTSKIIEWDDKKGFGYLLHQKNKLFLHRKDFAERHKRPSKGDRIHYNVGKDPKGRRCAVEAVHVNDGGRLTLLTWCGLALLLLIPFLALNKIIVTNNISPWFVVIPILLINCITYSTYKSDKAKARAKEWRTMEVELHLLGLIGGWPAAFLAQRQFRHKCSKSDFQAVYWMTVCMFTYLSVDYILGWRIIKSIFAEAA